MSDDLFKIHLHIAKDMGWDPNKIIKRITTRTGVDCPFACGDCPTGGEPCEYHPYYGCPLGKNSGTYKKQTVWYRWMKFDRGLEALTDSIKEVFKHHQGRSENQ